MASSWRVSTKSSVNRSSAVMSRLLEHVDRAFGTVEHRQACTVLFAWQHGALADDRPVALVVRAEQTGSEVVAAAVPLAALGVALYFHCRVPVRAVKPAAGRCGVSRHLAGS